MTKKAKATKAKKVTKQTAKKVAAKTQPAKTTTTKPAATTTSKPATTPATKSSTTTTTTSKPATTTVTMPATEQTYKPNTTAIAAAVHQYVNQLRAKNNLQPLAIQAKLSQNAVNRAKLQTNGLSHDNYESAFDGTGLPYLHSENVAQVPVEAATSDQAMGKLVVQLWYEDEGIANKGHQKNMLCPLVNTEGIGVYESDDNLYVAEDLANSQFPDENMQITWMNYFNSNDVHASNAL
ncbi:Cell surface protein, LPXTG-motif cell wall anchor [Lactiplantibacillus plantarum]|nr:Cell surface protein, LPXTG-motif cell wall anchor [Lactiplantibacillus plantarum]